jgi:hypothetical protein
MVEDKPESLAVDDLIALPFMIWTLPCSFLVLV